MSIKHRISKRKREVLELAAEGKTDKEIAASLQIGVETVHSHWKSLRAEFDVSSRTELLARVLIEEQTRQRSLLESEREELLFQLAESNRLRAELDAANATLKVLTEKQATLLSETLAATDKKLSVALKRLDHLEGLNALTRKNKVVLHEGEYGSSWRKYFMSESVDFSGSTNEQWVSGEVNFFDYILPEFIEPNIPQISQHPKGTHRVALNYLIKTPNGIRHMLDLLTCDIVDDLGTGKYHGVSIDITEWSENLIDLVKAGRLEVTIPDGTEAQDN